MNHGIVNKNAFQSTAQLMLADRKSNTYNLTSEWPWLWCNFNIIDDLDLTQIKLMSKWQISIFLEMTLTLTQWPWHDLDLRQVKLSWTDVQVAKLASPWDDLDLNPMTLKLKHDLDIVKMYHHTKNEVSMLTSSKVIAQTDRQTDTHTHTHMTKTKPPPHTWEVNIPFSINFDVSKQQQRYHMKSTPKRIRVIEFCKLVFWSFLYCWTQKVYR